VSKAGEFKTIDKILLLGYGKRWYGQTEFLEGQVFLLLTDVLFLKKASMSCGRVWREGVE
jgi:hypothetical protein